MPREIWNEGRVVGESAYEIYVKHHLSEDPYTPPASEREWLASNLAMGASMLLRVPEVTQSSDTDITFVDIQLPRHSTLAAANTIVASFFDGDGEFDSDSDWATKIIDYGQLISNTDTLHPAEGEAVTTTVIPTQTLSGLSDIKKSQLYEYMHIIDGIVIQPGTWKRAEVDEPYMDFEPRLHEDPLLYAFPRIRLQIRGSITHSPRILLTGFTINSVLSGSVGTDGSTNTNHPYNGDFLGPEDFPWSSKIIFSVPNSFINYYMINNYSRELESPTAETQTATEETIKDSAVVDMRATDPGTFYDDYASYGDYYSASSSNPRYQYDVTGVTAPDSNSGASVITVYQKKAIYPPALYGTLVTTTGTSYLNPLDIVAPGSVKMFYNQTASVLDDYQQTFPGTWALNRTTTGGLQILVGTGSSATLVDIGSGGGATQTVSDLHTNADGGALSPGFFAPDTSGSVSNYAGASGSHAEAPKAVMITNDSSQQMYIRIGDSAQIDINENPNNRSDYTNPSIKLTHANSTDDIIWSALLVALQNNKAIDLLGDGLKSAKYTMQKPVVAGAGWSTTNSEYDTTTGAAHITFGPTSGTNLRFYVTKEQPDASATPEKSVGSGWLLPNYVHYREAPSKTWKSYASWPYEYRKNTLKASVASIPELAVAVGSIGLNLSQNFWQPIYGAEFNSGHILASTATCDPSTGTLSDIIYSFGYIYVESGLIIFGSSGTIAGGTAYSPTIAYIDSWGGINYIHNDTHFLLKTKTYVNSGASKCYAVKMKNALLYSSIDSGSTEYTLKARAADFMFCGVPLISSTQIAPL